MVRALASLHRWLAIPLAPLFAMWFASGIVMHAVPFPRLTETERIAGLVPLDPSPVIRGPAEAVAASGRADAMRVRLIRRSDGPVYVVDGRSASVALHADDLSNARVTAPELARAIALAHARQRGLGPDAAHAAQVVALDQWTVAGGLDRHRPLYRVALDDETGTELYVSSATGEVVCDTTRRERWWNALGSIPHWIYPTALRSRPRIWSTVLWTLSLAGSIAALAGSALGIVRLGRQAGRLVTPYRGWHAWHHLGGLVCMPFVLAWMLSGWLSMDDGRLFPGGTLTSAEAAVLIEAPAPDAWPRLAPRPIAGPASETEWFWLNGTLYQRDRVAAGRQRLSIADSGALSWVPHGDALTSSEITALAHRLSPYCATATVDTGTDAYALAAPMPGAPTYRVTCGDTWFDLDAANGAVLQRLDPSRRVYRWLYRALHTWDVPVLTAHPALHGALMILLCGCGIAFSLTGCAIGWQRLGLLLRTAGHGRAA